jgi:hypothetical protein
MKERIERMQGDVHRLLEVLREEARVTRGGVDRRLALTRVEKGPNKP